MAEKTPLTPAQTFAQKIAKSTQVLDVRYWEETRELLVVFQGTEAIYTYSDFQPDKWAELQAAESIGSWLYKNVTKREVAWRFTRAALTNEDYQVLARHKAAVRAAIQAET